MRLRAEPVPFEKVIEKYAEIGIGHWCTHDTDVIPPTLYLRRSRTILSAGSSNPSTNTDCVLHGDHETFHHRLRRESR